MTLRESVDDPIVPEAVRDNWAAICDFNNSLHPKNNQEASMLLGGILQELMDKDATKKSNLSPVVIRMIKQSIKLFLNSFLYRNNP